MRPLLRAIGEATTLPPYRGYFTDVPAGLWYTGSVERLFELGITTGFPDGGFHPTEVVNRAQMAAFILRALGEDEALPVHQGYFTDVTADAWYRGYAEKLYQMGITTGCAVGPLRYCPTSPVRRDQMATFLTRALNLTPIVPVPCPVGELVTVVSVTDGDTIRVRYPSGVVEPVRLIGIDSPERNECGADAATAYLRSLVDGKQVRMEQDVSNRDRYDRLLRYIYLGDVFVNESIVWNGHATAVRYPPDTAKATILEAAQAAAQAAGRGIWSPTGGCVTTTTTVRSGCDPAYPTVCIPSPPPDLDCGQITYRRFKVLPPDPHRFDGDNDGIGCES